MMWTKYGWCRTLEKRTVSFSSSNKMVRCPNFYQSGRISQQQFPTAIKWQTGRPTVDPFVPGSNLISLFFYGNTTADSPYTQCLSILMYPKFAFQVAVNRKTQKYCPMFGTRMITIFMCHQWGSHWRPVSNNQDSQISSVHLWIS